MTHALYAAPRSHFEADLHLNSQLKKYLRCTTHELRVRVLHSCYLEKGNILYYASCAENSISMVASPRILRDRSRSREPSYSEELYDDELKKKEDSLDFYHRNQGGRKFIVVKGMVDGACRIVDFTKRRSDKTRLKLLEEEYAKSSYEDAFYTGDTVLAYFPKTGKTAAAFYKATIEGVCSLEKEATDLYHSLRPQRKGKEAESAKQKQRRMALLSAELSVPESSEILQVTDTGLEAARESRGEFHSPTYDGGSTIIQTYLDQAAAVVIASFEATGSHLPHLQQKKIIGPINATNRAPETTHPPPQIAKDSDPKNKASQKHQRKKRTKRSDSGEASNPITRRKRAPPKQFPSVSAEVIGRRNAVKPVAPHMPSTVFVTDKIDSPIIRGSKVDGYSYEFYWQNHTSPHQQAIMHGFDVYVYTDALIALNVYAPTLLKPSWSEYGVHFAAHLMGGTKGIIKCYSTCRQRTGLDKFLGAETFIALAGYISKLFEVEVDVVSFKSHANTRIRTLFNRRNGKTSKPGATNNDRGDSSSSLEAESGD